MSKTVSEVMTRDPFTVKADSSVAEAARQMRDRNIGDVLVNKNNALCGILTDRDIVVRVVAEGRSVTATKVEEVCSRDLTNARPDESVDDALDRMQKTAIRRLPVVESGKAIGIVSLGDLAVDLEKDPHTSETLAGISAAPPNT